jgi:nucleotide-binding universal stress UspA family protein
MAIRRVLVPIDGTEGSIRAVRFAADLAESAGASITLLHVYDASAVAIMGMSALSGAEVDDAIARVSAAFLEKARKEALVRAPLEVRTLSKVGHPSDEIVDLAEAEGADLIVVGSRGLSSFQGLLVGSVSDRVVHRAPCPVTVVH